MNPVRTASAGPILVVHDDADVRTVLMADLRAAGYPDVVGAADGMAGLDAALAHRPSLVIADIHMPVLDGFQLLRLLRGTGPGGGIPVILLSASYRDPAAARLAADLGAAAFVQAPYEPERLRREVARVLAEGGSAAARAPSARILVVEDEPDVAMVLVATLRTRGYSVDSVGDGRTALERIPRERPDLLVLDYHMPGLTGLDVLREARAAGADCGAIVLTAHASIPLSVEFVRAGAEEILEKPFEPATLLASIGRALERRALSMRASQFREKLEAAKRSEARCRSLVEMSRDVILRLDREGRITMASPAAGLLTGQLLGDLVGRPAAELMTAGTRPPVLASIADGEGTLVDIEADLWRPDGRTVPLSLMIQPLLEEGVRTGFWVVGRDLRRQRTLARRLAEAEKRAGIGRLVSGISHEFSSLVGGILGYSELALGRWEPGAARESLQKIRETGLRASDLLSILRLLVTAEPGSEPLDPEALATEAGRRARGAFEKARVGLESSADEGLPEVTGSRDAVLRILGELLSNARHACVEAGAGHTAWLRSRRSAQGVEWTVADDANGIPPQDLQRVFEPFYTTKGALGGRVHDGKVHGTGLGLAVARALAEAQGGTLELLSVQGKGTVARLWLPEPNRTAVRDMLPVTPPPAR
ncbi:MAG: response regulator [Planctomycetales bacterium]|nr:response regulator [Planctomycetales bacterium]